MQERTGGGSGGMTLLKHVPCIVLLYVVEEMENQEDQRLGLS